MRRYIYLFDSGEIRQSEYPPTETDLELCDRGELNVLIVDYEHEAILYLDECDVDDATLLDGGFHIP